MQSLRPPRVFIPTARPVVWTLALLLLAGACDFQRTVDLQAPTHEPKLVVNGEIVAGAPWRIDVSRSVGAFQPGTPSDTASTVTDATVTVFEEGERQGQLRLDSLNQYSTRQFTPEGSRQYTVQVSAPELDTVTTTDRVPRMPPVQLLAEESQPGNDYYDRALRLTIDDPPDSDNYYHIRLQKKGYRKDSTSIDTLGLTDVRFQTRNRSIIDEMGQVLEEANAYQGREATFRDVLFGGTEHTIGLQVEGGSSGFYLPDEEEGDSYPRVKYFLYVSVLSEDAYQFDHTERLFDRTDGNPFAEPVDVHSNVDGGYGIVAGRHTDTLRAEVVLE
jgi:hypothetical protein